MPYCNTRVLVYNVLYDHKEINAQFNSTIIKVIISDYVTKISALRAEF